MLDESEIYVKEFASSLINLYKLCIEELGYDMGYTNNEIEYRNYLVNNPISISGSSYNKPYEQQDIDPYVESGESDNGNISAVNSGDGNEYNDIKLISIDTLVETFNIQNREYAAATIAALEKYGSTIGLNSRESKLYVLAQILHESNNFRALEESGKGYKHTTGTRTQYVYDPNLKKKIKKIMPNYGAPSPTTGKIYYGRGPMQLTWEANYIEMTYLVFPELGIDADIWRDPDLVVRDLNIAAATAIGWFKLEGLNAKNAIKAANAGDVKALTKAINGGYNGLQDRINKTNKILTLV